jgi:hypothetical protein
MSFHHLRPSDKADIHCHGEAYMADPVTIMQSKTVAAFRGTRTVMGLNVYPHQKGESTSQCLDTV